MNILPRVYTVVKSKYNLFLKFYQIYWHSFVNVLNHTKTAVFIPLFERIAIRLLFNALKS